MPVDRSLGEDLAETIRDLYSSAEQRLVADIAARLRSGLDRSDWAERKLAQISQVRELADRIIDRLDGDLAEEQVEQLLVLAYVRGGEAGLDELARLGRLDADQVAAIRRELPGTAAIQRLAFSLASTLRGTHLRILRWSLDAYRQVVATAAVDTLLGTATRLRTAQRAWERLLSRGITGFVDRSGRHWELASYVEMATRTTVAQAAVEGHLDRLAAAGIDLVIVSNAPQECDRCRPWEGQVLARRGVEGRQTIEVQHATQDRTIRVDVRGTVDEAIRAGLMHPNCRHSLSAYLPGVTRAPRNTADPDGDEARQELRRLERKVREWKRRAAGALDPAAAAAAQARVRDYQRQIREHVADTGLIRQRHREQIGTAR